MAEELFWSRLGAYLKRLLVGKPKPVMMNIDYPLRDEGDKEGNAPESDLLSDLKMRAQNEPTDDKGKTFTQYDPEKHKLKVKKVEALATSKPAPKGLDPNVMRNLRGKGKD